MVWCELALTVSRSSQSGPVFTLYGRGSVFPSHAWYFSGKRVLIQDQVYDAVVPKKATVFNTKVGPALRKGAPASVSQISSTEQNVIGPVDIHPYTVEGEKVLSHVVSVILLAEAIMCHAWLGLE